jgi:hypothetical protein
MNPEGTGMDIPVSWPPDRSLARPVSASYGRESHPADSFHPSLPIPAFPLSLVPATAGAGAARPLPHAGRTPQAPGSRRAEAFPLVSLPIQPGERGRQAICEEKL